MKTNLNMQDALAYLDKIGVKYTYENDPSPEVIEGIKKQIAESEIKAREIADLIFNKTK
jgi:hypothetical protein